jgi:hypothetical protein
VSPSSRLRRKGLIRRVTGSHRYGRASMIVTSNKPFSKPHRFE